MEEAITQQQTTEVTIRNLLPEEMFIITDLAAMAGTNPGINDGEFLFKADNNGFIAAIEDNKVNGTIAVIKYPNNLAFIGLHFVVEHYRNSGLMEKLLSVALDIAGERNIGVNCKEEYVSLYENAGFKPAFKIVSYEGISDEILNELPQNINSPHLTPYDKVYDYYGKTFPYEGKMFFNQWLNQPQSLLFGKYENDKYKGLGLLKPCRKGFRLSPLIADDRESAKEILTSLVSHYPAGTPYYLDIPVQNMDGINLAEELKLKKIGEALRMYKGKEHKISLNNIYSFTSMEIG